MQMSSSWKQKTLRRLINDEIEFLREQEMSYAVSWEMSYAVSEIWERGIEVYKK